MSLRTGVEMISLSILFNKITGFYGLLAILTGYHLDAIQLSMYIYSIGALVLTGLLMPHIRKQSPLECLALAWFYAMDTIINILYTAAFAGTFFVTMSAAHSDTAGNVPAGAPGSGTMGDTAGFTNPEFDVSKVDVAATAGGLAGQDAVAVGTAAIASAASANPSVHHGVQLAEGIPSLVVISVLTVIRIYFILVMMAYARQVIRQYMETAQSSRTHLHTDGASDGETPFEPQMPHGQGWKGKLGRTLVRMGNGYFVGGPVDDEWAKGLSNRFKTTGPPSRTQQDTFERERRARSGTGPPPPPPKLQISV
jgi:hypothetical protein